MRRRNVIEVVGSWLRSKSGARWVRYSAVSAISLTGGQITLALCFGALKIGARVSNLLAFAVGAILSYSLNRRWTWGRTGRSHLLREILPFGVIAVAGLLLSTWAVSVAERAASSFTDSRALQTSIVMTASLAAFGTLWVLKFFAFDRVLFRTRPRRGRAA